MKMLPCKDKMSEEKTTKVQEIYKEYSEKIKDIFGRKKNLLSNYRKELEKEKIDQITRKLKGDL
jgi:molecular chaperone GrpE (heat shock protein)